MPEFESYIKPKVNKIEEINPELKGKIEGIKSLNTGAETKAKIILVLLYLKQIKPNLTNN